MTSFSAATVRAAGWDDRPEAPPARLRRLGAQFVAGGDGWWRVGRLNPASRLQRPNAAGHLAKKPASVIRVRCSDSLDSSHLR